MKFSLINKKNFNLQIIGFALISFLPFTLLIGSAVINSVIILIDIFFIIELIKNQNIKYLNNKLFYIFMLFWSSLLINTLFSDSFESSLARAVGFLRFIFLVFAIKYYFSFSDYFYKDKIFRIWFILLLLVSVDLIFESIFGFNILGYSNDLTGRLSGFLNQELKIGHFYFGFILISLSFIHYEYKNIFLLYLFISIFLTISFLIGERSNFIKTFIVLFLFVLFMDRDFILRKIFFIFTLIGLITSIVFFNDTYKERFYTMLITPIMADVMRDGEKLKFSNALKTNQYGAHYDTAIKVFKNNVFFGTGLKNFRNESSKKEYINKEFAYNHLRQTTHPHQLHFELLSETGLFGYFSFFIFFIYFLKVSIKQQILNRNLYHLSGILFIFATFLPLLPSGSFFTTFGATIFWINFSIIESFNKNYKIKS